MTIQDYYEDAVAYVASLPGWTDKHARSMLGCPDDLADSRDDGLTATEAAQEVLIASVA